jgi:hypothetical protein
MSIVTESAILLGACGVYCVYVHEEGIRQKKRQEIMNKIMESRKKNEKTRKKNEKRIFITKFIDEIPELSYYEAVQLKNKLGDIYLEWNDE